MIDISIKSPPPPTPPRHSEVDPVVSIPRSHKIDPSESDRASVIDRRKERKEKQREQDSNQGDSPPGEDSDHHIDNYA